MSHSSLGKPANQDQPHWIEWLTGVVSTLMIVAMICWIVFEASTTADLPPNLSAEVLKVEPVDSGWRVMIQVRNEGDQAAAAVTVKATLLDGGNTIDEAETTFDYVAGGSTSRGGLIFKQDPARFELQVMPSGFTEP